MSAASHRFSEIIFRFNSHSSWSSQTGSGAWREVHAKMCSIRSTKLVHVVTKQDGGSAAKASNSWCFGGPKISTISLLQWPARTPLCTYWAEAGGKHKYQQFQLQTRSALWEKQPWKLQDLQYEVSKMLSIWLSAYNLAILLTLNQIFLEEFCGKSMSLSSFLGQILKSS